MFNFGLTQVIFEIVICKILSKNLTDLNFAFILKKQNSLMNHKNPNILNWKPVKNDKVLLKTDKNLYKWSMLSILIYKLMVSPK